jgi:5-methylthioadenosine/S-adenosylhomocysteine deaminase
MATRLGGRAIHQLQLGVLAPGYQADVLMLTLDDTTMVPIFEDRTYIDHLVYASGRELVDSVWVNGARVVKEGTVLTVDEGAVRRAAQQAAMAVLRRAEG